MRYELPRGYLSASAIRTLQTCPRQYEFRYIEGRIIPPNAALAVGSMTHRTLETYYRDAMTSAVRLSPDQAGELSVTVLDDWVRDNEHAMSADDVEGARRLLPDAVSAYVRNIGSRLRPLAVEEEVRVTMACGVPMLAYIDLRCTPLDAEGERLADYKVTSRKLSMRDLSDSLQFNIYALLTGVSDIEIHNIVKTRGKPASKPSFQDGVTDYASNLRTLRHSFDGSQAAHFERLVEAAARLITSGVFMPCDPMAWNCTPEWCGYWKLCRGRG